MLEIKFVRNTNSFGINRKIHQVGFEIKYSYIGGFEKQPASWGFLITLNVWFGKKRSADHEQTIELTVYRAFYTATGQLTKENNLFADLLTVIKCNSELWQPTPQLQFTCD